MSTPAARAAAPVALPSPARPAGRARARDGLVLAVAARAAGVALGFGTAVALARGLGAEARGTFALCVAYAEITATLSSVGVHEAVAVHTARGARAPAAILGTGMGLSGLTGILAALLAALAILSGGLPLPNGAVSVGLAALLAVPFLRLHHVVGAFLRGRNDFAAFALVQVARSLLTLLAVVVGVVALDLGLPAAAAAFVLAAAIPSIAGARRAARDVGRPRLDAATARETVGFGLRGWPGAIASILSRRLDLVLLAGFVAAEPIGHYVVATQIAEVLLYFPSAATMVLLPWTSAATLPSSRGIPEGVRAWFGRIAALHLALCALAAWGAPLLGPLLLETLFGPEYVPAIEPLRWLVPAALLLGFSLLLGSVLTGVGRPGANALAGFAGLLAAVPAYLLLVPRWGIRGAALGSAIAYGVQAGAQAILLLRRRSR